MHIGYSIFFFFGALCPGFFLYQFYKDARDEAKRTGKFSMETLIGNPGLFYSCLAAFVGLLVISIVCFVRAL